MCYTVLRTQFHVNSYFVIAPNYFVLQSGTRMKIRKTQVIRARCDASLKGDVDRIAFIKQLDPADIIRIAVRDYVQKFRSADAANWTQAKE
jgi:hypothetical protein